MPRKRLLLCHASTPCQSVNITGVCLFHSLHMAALVANEAVASLTRITLQHRHISLQRPAGRSVMALVLWREQVQEVWDNSVVALLVGQCRRLQHLRMQIPHSTTVHIGLQAGVIAAGRVCALWAGCPC